MNTAEQYFQIPSPLHKIHLFNKEVWIKRDDLIHPFVSGNKLRKIFFHAKHAKEDNAQILVSYGGYYSNHLLALAAYGAIGGFQTKGFVKGERPKKINPILKLCKLYGMEIAYLTRGDFANQRQSFGKIGNQYFIPEGGASSLGAKGCQAIVEELPNSFDHIITPVGTGTTLSGILQSVEQKKWETEIHAISVVNDRLGIEKLVKSITTRQYTFYQKLGFQKLNTEELAVVKELVQKSGILLDPIYGAKAMNFLKDAITSGKFKNDETILYIHTGGKTGWLSEKMTNHLMKL